MNSSRDYPDRVTDALSAVQQKAASRHAPRPLPLFLELVRIVSETQPELAAKALEGLSRYEEAPRLRLRPERTQVARVRGASLRDCGGEGAPVVLVPSLINPPDVLDLDEQVSLAGAIAGMGRRALLLDWGKAQQRSELDLGGHVEALLLPLVRDLGEPVALVGYCLGGTMAVSAASLIEAERLVTLAAPWRFSAYPQDARQALLRLWDGAKAGAQTLGALPMEVLQGAFWSLDPERTVAKFAHFAELPADSGKARRFVALEDWANEGEPLPYPAARELIEDLFGDDLPGNGGWKVGGAVASAKPSCPALHITASEDRIAPASTAPRGETVKVDSGDVGMVVGSARAQLHAALAKFLSPSCR
jgi:polyhydroxyalkanoate synthase